MPILSYPEQKLMHYTAIGDSLTVGKGSGLFEPGFVERFTARFGMIQHQPIIPYKFAKNGATSEEILRTTELPQISEIVGGSEIVTLTSGGNDLIDGGIAFLRTRQISAIETGIQSALTNNWRLVQYIQQVQQTFNNRYGQIYLFNMYNPFPMFKESDQGIQQYNQHLESLTQLPSVRVVDIYSAFKGRTSQLLSRDGVHPNSEGYQVMADTLMRYTK